MRNKEQICKFSTDHILRSTKLLLICSLLLTSFLLSSCQSDQLIKDLQREIKDRQRIQQLTSAVEESFGKIGILGVGIDDEAKTFVLIYHGPETIAEFDDIRVIINDFLDANPNFF
jgi:hypothetical protein